MYASVCVCVHVCISIYIAKFIYVEKIFILKKKFKCLALTKDIRALMTQS